MNTMHQELMQFVLDKAESEPPSKRAKLYRALAEICGDANDAKALRIVATGIEEAESRCQEFKFKFKSAFGGI